VSDIQPPLTAGRIKISSPSDKGVSKFFKERAFLPLMKKLNDLLGLPSASKIFPLSLIHI